jgi:hypothetical protein
VDAPEHIRAVLDALRFTDASTRRLETLPASAWNRLFAFCDSRQLTLLLHSACGNQLPEQLREQMDARRRRYALRFERLKEELFTIARSFDAASLEFCLLKGFTHSPMLTPDPETRAQGDIDLWIAPGEIPKAKRILAGLGYSPLGIAKSRHIAPMVRQSTWKWRGDYFDSEMPVAVEIHYELWSDRAEAILVPGAHDFWQRKVTRSFDGQRCNVLCDADLIGFAGLHLLLHVLHGELPMQRAWEIGRFLHTHSSCPDFWRLWTRLHSPDLKRLEVIAFHLVSRWFDCAWPQDLDTELNNLPPGVREWMKRFWRSPMERYWRPNKDEVWLHLALLNGIPMKTRVLLRRLLPIHGRHFQLARLRHHFSTLLPTLFQGLRSIASPGIDSADNTRHCCGQNEDVQTR